MLNENSKLNHLTIENPILPGFNPDPSIIRVGEDYYIANSTFQWFPGVQIHHSRDLKNWKLISRPLDRLSQLNMEGNPPSGGIWAPCLSYSKGTFYLVYTDVKSLNTTYKDTHNYLVTAKEITGPWSEPVYLNSSGFDPSLFHDQDGRKWLVNMIWDYRPREKNRFKGILLQEYSEEEKRLIREARNIFKGTELGVTEGPHLYRLHGYYYLLTAEGGTGVDHAVTMARSKNIEGPYEVDPQNPILTSRDTPSLVLQKAGHGDIVDTPGGEWFMVHLCSRPHPGGGRSILGRETAIQPMKWTDDLWLRKAGGGNKPDTVVKGPALPHHPWPEEPERDHFDEESLSIHFQTLRLPLAECSLTERPGFLRLYGGESFSSCHKQSLVARRQDSFAFTATTSLEFDPQSFQQNAGLVYFYSIKKYHYFYLSLDEDLRPVLDILSNADGSFSQPLKAPVPVKEGREIFLRLQGENDRCRFYFSFDENKWEYIGVELDSSILSDEFGEGYSFTGAFTGLCCQDLTGARKYADFDFFEYVRYLK